MLEGLRTGILMIDVSNIAGLLVLLLILLALIGAGLGLGVNYIYYVIKKGSSMGKTIFGITVGIIAFVVLAFFLELGGL